jgi:hypothetical protein
MVFRFIPLSFVFLFSLTASLHATVTVLVEEVDNGDGGTDVVATATGTLDKGPLVSNTSKTSKIELDSKKFLVGPSDTRSVIGSLFTPSEAGIWNGSEKDSAFPDESVYRGPSESDFSTNTSYLLGVEDVGFFISETLYNDLSSSPGDIGTIRSTWADKSFSDLAIAYNSTWTLEWDGGGEGKTLTYNAIPEPSQYGVLFGLAAAAAAVGLRRRRRAGGAS